MRNERPRPANHAPSALPSGRPARTATNPPDADAPPEPTLLAAWCRGMSCSKCTVPTDTPQACARRSGSDSPRHWCWPVVAAAHAALVAALLLHRQAFRTPPEVLPTTIAVSLVSPLQSTPPPVFAPVSAAPPPPEPATLVATEPPPKPPVAKPKPTKPKPRPNRAVRPPELPPPRRPHRLRPLRRRLRHRQGLRRQPPRRPRRRVFRRTTSVTPPRPTPGCRGSAARRDR
jgi:hypothetical protein